MKTETRSTGSWTLLGACGVALVVAFMHPTDAKGQGQGNNAVYKNATTCCQESPAFIDASVFASAQRRDFCAVLNFILNPTNAILPPGSPVIDARGLNPNNTSMKCNSSPWGSGSSYLNVASTILLPATGAHPIVIPSTWVLPNNTRLVGEGDNDPSGSTPNTTIQACLQTTNSCSWTGPDMDMIDLGTLSVCGPTVCNDVSVESLTLDGQGQFLNGIANTDAQIGTQVNHVTLYAVMGTGLSVSAGCPTLSASFAERVGGDQENRKTRSPNLGTIPNPYQP